MSAELSELSELTAASTIVRGREGLHTLSNDSLLPAASLGGRRSRSHEGSRQDDATPAAPQLPRLAPVARRTKSLAHASGESMAYTLRRHPELAYLRRVANAPLPVLPVSALLSGQPTQSEVDAVLAAGASPPVPSSTSGPAVTIFDHSSLRPSVDHSAAPARTDAPQRGSSAQRGGSGGGDEPKTAEAAALLAADAKEDLEALATQGKAVQMWAGQDRGWAVIRRAVASGAYTQLKFDALTPAERRVDVAWHVRKCPLFATCSKRQVAAITKECTVQTVPRYTVLYREGTVAQGAPLVLVATGAIKLRGFDDAERFVRPPTLMIEPSGKAHVSYCGVEAAAADCGSNERRRAETAVVDTRSIIICVPTEAMPLPAREQARVRANIRLLQPTDEKSLSIFRDMPPSQMRSIAKLFNYVFVPVGAYVMRQGEMKDNWYTLVWGEVSVVVEKMGIAPIHSGEGAMVRTVDVVVDVVNYKSDYKHFGEGSFMQWTENAKLGMHKRTASIIATQPSWCASRAGACSRPSRRGPPAAPAAREPEPSRRARRACARRLLEMKPTHFTAVTDLVPGIIDRFKISRKVQERNHQMKQEQLSEEALRKMLARHSTKFEERMKLMKSSRRHRLELAAKHNGAGTAALAALMTNP